jgi:hypothetical protein
LITLAIVFFFITPVKFFSRHYKRSEKGVRAKKLVKQREKELKKEMEKNASAKTTPRKENIFEDLDPNDTIVEKSSESENMESVEERASSNMSDKSQVLRELDHHFNIVNKEKYERFSDFSIFSVIDREDNISQKISYFRIISNLFTNKLYVNSMFAVSSLLFIITGIQFWITDYMKVIMHVPEEKVFVFFSLICITAPSAGVLIGGYIIEKSGGYHSFDAINSCYKLSIMAAIAGLPLPLVNNFWIFCILIWLCIFFGGCILPGMTGIIMSSIPGKFKTSANSITHLCYNLFGYLPSPLLYGVICNLTGGKESKWGLVFLMSISLIGVFLLKRAKDEKVRRMATEVQHEIINADKTQNNLLHEQLIDMENKKHMAGGGEYFESDDSEAENKGQSYKVDGAFDRKASGPMEMLSVMYGGRVSTGGRKV